MAKPNLAIVQKEDTGASAPTVPASPKPPGPTPAKAPEGAPDAGKKSSGFKKLKAKLPIISLSMVVVLTCAGLLFRHYRRADGDDIISTMENRLLDMRFRLRGPVKPSDKIGILGIDEKTLQKFGRWPISRKNYEQAFKNLKKLGTEWIGFDVTWSEPERAEVADLGDNLKRIKSIDGNTWREKLDLELKKIDAAMAISSGDQSVARMIKEYEKIVMGYIYYASKRDAEQLGSDKFQGMQRMAKASAIENTILPEKRELSQYRSLMGFGVVPNIDYIAASAKHFAFFNNESDEDAIMRWVSLVRVLDGQLMPSLSLKMAANILGREIVAFFDEYGITDISLMNPDNDQDLIKVPLDASWGRLLLNHLGPDRTIPHYSLADAFDNSFTPEQKKALKGKSLLLGPTAIGINDMRANPFDPVINGVENHAAAIDNILTKRFMRRTENAYITELGIVIAIGLIFTPMMIFARAAVSALAALLFLVGYYYFDKFFWFGRGDWMYIGMPFIEITTLFIGTTLYKYMVEEKERKKVKGTFSLYLSPEVIDQVLDDPEALKLGGERKELTVFFSDVRSFTTISESLTPEKLCELMNDYFTPMTSIILRSKGVLDKYIGDAIMAFWGAPILLPNHAEVAARASIEMLYALDKLRVDLPKKGFPMVDIGIGLNTGSMSVGNMGSGERFCYTVMGDSVNLGSRLEGLTKEYGIKILISEFTAAKITANDIFKRDLDDIRVKGKLEPVKVFEIMRPDVLKAESHIRNLIFEFEQGRAAYRAQDWKKCRAHFMQCLTIRPDDGPANVYLERIEEREKEPAIPNWDGVYTFTHK